MHSTGVTAVVAKFAMQTLKNQIVSEKFGNAGWSKILVHHAVHTVLRSFTATIYFARVYSLIDRRSYGGHGQQHCLICGGPANWRQWQHNHVGITEDNVPVDFV